jgi:polar amino acid transport system substrate-binding protein
MSATMPPEVRQQLTTTGVLRAGLNYANFLLITRTLSGPRGIVPDLAGEIARRAGAQLEFVGYEAPGLVADAAATNAWDIAFIGAEPARANEIAFSAAYLEIEATYLVPAGSPIRALEEVDRPGVRIATSARSAYDLYLSRTLRHATLERAEGLDASYQLFVSKKLDVLSGLRPRLMQEVEKLPGARVLEGRFTSVQQAIGTPRGRDAAAAYLRAFVEETKASGLVAELIARHGVRGVSVAPPAP